MLSSVFLLYLILIVCFVRQDDLEDSSTSATSSMGPSSIRKQSLFNKKDHLARLRQSTIKSSPQILPQSKGNNAIKYSHLHDLEEMDIEGMFKPRHRVVGKQNNDTTTQTHHHVLQAIVRNNKNSTDVIDYRQVKTCQGIHSFWTSKNTSLLFGEQTGDPLLPNIQNLFSTFDGKYIQFEVKTNLECRNDENSVRRIKIQNETRYQLLLPSPDIPAAATTSSTSTSSFICRFEPNGLETLSVTINPQNNNDVSTTKQQPSGNKNDELSSSSSFKLLSFECPVPLQLVKAIRDGGNVPTVFLTIVPIPLKYNPSLNHWNDDKGRHNQGLNNNYNYSVVELVKEQDDDGGDVMILPKIEDSTRWANIPLCLQPPSSTAKLMVGKET